MQRTIVGFTSSDLNTITINFSLQDRAATTHLSSIFIHALLLKPQVAFFIFVISSGQHRMTKLDIFLLAEQILLQEAESDVAVAPDVTLVLYTLAFRRI